jgi:hypothetical protein
MLMSAGATTPAGRSYSPRLSSTAGQFPVPQAPTRFGDLLEKAGEALPLFVLARSDAKALASALFIGQV